MFPIRRVLVTLIFSALTIGLLGVSAEEPKLKFVSLEFSPFVYMKDGVVSGPGAEVITAVCHRINVQCDYRIYPWRRAQKLVKEGKAVGMMVVAHDCIL